MFGNIKGTVIAGDFKKNSYVIDTNNKSITIKKGKDGISYGKNRIVAVEKASDEVIRKFWGTTGGVVGGAIVGWLTLGLLTGGIGTIAGAVGGGLVSGKKQQLIVVFDDEKKILIEVKSKFLGKILFAFS